MMEQQLSKPERKNMDACLRRLKQELVSMKEAGDGLHAQMNSMMGALQELKLLQVQTALENLDVSGRPINRGPPQPAAPPACTAPAAAASHYAESDRPGSSQSMQLEEEEEPSPSPSPRPSLDSRDTSPDDQSCSQHNRSSLGSSSSSASASSSTSSLESSERSQRSQRRARSDSVLASASVPRRWSGYTAPQVDFCGPAVDNPPPETRSHEAPAAAQRPVDLPGILYSLSREGPSLDSDYCSQHGAGQESADGDDSSDWTSSLMSSRRNRQPLVLGDNVFADLVGNWLDLPELERDEREEGGGGGKRTSATTTDGEAMERPDSPAHPLRLSRSQEICRKFSLTTNIFKKFLRGVRPDRDKLLKERPGWAAELPEGGGGDLLLFKRPKKVAPSKAAKGGFYLPFWAAGAQQQQQQGKGARPCPLPPQQPRFSERSHLHLHLQQPPFPGVYIDRRRPAEKMQPLFDYNTAVWV